MKFALAAILLQLSILLPSARAAEPSPALTRDEVSGLRDQIHKCWYVSPAETNAPAVIVRLRIKLNRDGSVNGDPQIVDAPAATDARFTHTAAMAVRAVLMCGPYALPIEKYEQWKEITVTFDTRAVGDGWDSPAHQTLDTKDS